MKALVIGATGATGRDLVNILLNDPAYTAVVIFVRRSTGIVHHKLSEVITDFSNLLNISSAVNGDVWFSVLGTTLKVAGTKEKQWQIDHDIPLNFATIAKQNGVKKGVLLSAWGAAATSNIFYSKMKGRLEDAIAGLSFEALIIFRPGLLLRENTDRTGERVSAAVLKFFNGIGLFQKFKPLPTTVLAAKLAKAPKKILQGKHIIALKEIFDF
ncbi:NAD(P)H-binding protein [Panacibacter sp. DH6]|uniref:NAD(P)H-binding protein n=1 Tax=Panacibacter microcysteis TaxID=2793269 RepID=A0A931GV08_9BACT|nr:NAD(P)H-binding protein [Panacibacter microcysteis]MBG9374638.1 NAD(P)H-binding protein [Panacibacter microcysteis]